MEKTNYPGIFDRLKASVIDSIVIIFLIGASTEVFEIFDDSSIYFKMLFFLLIFLYEPIMVSLFGASIGHRMCKLKVCSDRTSKNLSLIKSIVRFLIKFMLGWVSLITISNNKQKKAMHDLVVNSVVTFDENYI